jgi:hypothetical protein
MKKLLMLFFAVLIMCVSASADSFYYGRSYYAEKALNEWSQKALFGYGFEADYEISHFFPITGDAVPAAGQNSNIQTESVKYLNTVDPEILKELYYEFYANNISLRYLINYYKSRKEWINYNHLTKKIEPDTKKYYTILKNFVESDKRCVSFVNDAETLKQLSRKTILMQQERLSTIENFR